MNKIYFKLVLLTLILFGIVACKKDGEQLTIRTSGTPVLTTSGTQVDLDATKANEKAVDLNWTKIDITWSDPAVATDVVTYFLEVGKGGTNFSGPKGILELDNDLVSYALTMSELNTLMNEAGCKSGEEAKVELRLVVSLAKNALIYSNTAEITATPFDPISYLYLPGAYQGWDPKTAESIVSSTSNGIYTGIIYFPENKLDFKITTERSWDTGASYGEISEGKIELGASANIKAPRAGNLEITVNTNTNTIAYEDNSWGILGDATPGGWETDTDMRYDNANQVWKITVNLTKGLFKFRKNHNWDVNLGGSAGTLTSGGDNISVEVAGTYSIMLDVLNNTYTLVKQ